MELIKPPEIAYAYLAAFVRDIYIYIYIYLSNEESYFLFRKEHKKEMYCESKVKVFYV